MGYLLIDKFKDVLISILPATIAVSLIATLILEMPMKELLTLAFCIILIVIGFTIFITGVEVGIDPMGSSIGMEIPKRRSRIFMIAVVFIISFLVTIAEPDVTVFSTQVSSLFTSINQMTLTYFIAAGVAFFLIIATFRIIYKLSLRVMITIGYIAVIALTLYLHISGNSEFIAIAFDSGGVTTGPITVPVLLALGIGICSVGAHRNKMEGFGMIGLASIGPIIALLIMGIISGNSSVSKITTSVEMVPICFELVKSEFIKSAISVLYTLIPLIVFFMLFQKVFLRYSWTAVVDMIEGVVFAGLGATIFLTGVYAGFMPLSTALGITLGKLSATLNPFIVVGIGLILGFLVAFAEPAVSILGYQVEKTSRGLLSRKLIMMIISSGVAVLVAIGMAKTVFNFDFVWIIVPGYTLTIILMWYGGKDMVGIAFDAGGVSTGPMSVAILSSIYVGLSSNMYSGTAAVINGFGLISLIALAPCLFLIILSIYMKRNRSPA